MIIKPLKLDVDNIPEQLLNIPTPPKQIYIRGDLASLMAKPRIAVVGSRKASPYGIHITQKLAGELAGKGAVIVSGLALGTDSVAHRAALEAGGLTIAVLPASVNEIYPASHRQLAAQIVERGGALVSEYPDGTIPLKGNFLARNRLISGLSDGVLIPEAAQRSGSLNTANAALEQGRVVMAVPGNITSLTSAGTNNLIKSGAVPITCTEDVLTALGLRSTVQTSHKPTAANLEEETIIDLLASGIAESQELLLRSKLSAPLFNQTLTMLEITGKIKPIGGGNWILA